MGNSIFNLICGFTFSLKNARLSLQPTIHSILIIANSNIHPQLNLQCKYYLQCYLVLLSPILQLIAKTCQY